MRHSHLWHTCNFYYQVVYLSAIFLEFNLGYFCLRFTRIVVEKIRLESKQIECNECDQLKTTHSVKDKISKTITKYTDRCSMLLYCLVRSP